MKRKITFIALVLALLLLVSSCSVFKPSIVGTWRNQNTILGVVTETVYTFNEDGTGTMSKVFGIEIPFTYSIEGNTLSVVTTTLGIENKTDYTMTKKGDKLTLQDGDDIVTYTKDK